LLPQVRALVLSAPYLPSQLEAFHATAAKLQHSLAVLVGRSELHVVVSQLPWQDDADSDLDDNDDDCASSGQEQQQQQQQMPLWQQVLLDALRPACLLDPGQLVAAEDAEAVLLAQRRLFNTAVWNAAAQQLQAKHCLLPWLSGVAVMSGEQLRSLRGLAATQGLHLAVEDMQELQQQQQQQAGLEFPANGSSTRSRRRLKGRCKQTTSGNAEAAAAAAAAAAAPAEQAVPAAAAKSNLMPAAAGAVQEVLLVLSKQPLAAADLALARSQAVDGISCAAAAAADAAKLVYQPGMSLMLTKASSSSGSSGGNGSAVEVEAGGGEAGQVLGARMHVSALAAVVHRWLQCAVHCMGTVSKLHMLCACRRRSIGLGSTNNYHCVGGAVLGHILMSL
jgi:hypothetical protein